MPLLGKHVGYVASPQTQNVMRIFRSAEWWRGRWRSTQKLRKSLWLQPGPCSTGAEAEDGLVARSNLPQPLQAVVGASLDLKLNRIPNVCRGRIHLSNGVKLSAVTVKRCNILASNMQMSCNSLSRERKEH